MEVFINLWENSNMINILLVEDEKQIVKNLTDFLTDEGFAVISCNNQEDALTLLSIRSFDLCLLDITLPSGNGFTLCKAIKKEYGTPVIFLTASSDEYSLVAGFDLGCDDYISKPFRTMELLSRIKNVLRLTKKSDSNILIDNLVIDTGKGAVYKNNQDLYLSSLEYRLLLILINNRGEALTRNTILERIWDISGEFVNDNTLTVYIKRLREKIEDDPNNPRVIKTIRGIGYRID